MTRQLTILKPKQTGTSACPFVRYPLSLCFILHACLPVAAAAGRQVQSQPGWTSKPLHQMSARVVRVQAQSTTAQIRAVATAPCDAHTR